jgi:hypothetical protein
VSCSNYGQGWFISALSPNSGAGSTSRVRFLVAIRDRDAARRAIEAWYPGSEVIVEGEAGAEAIAKHRVKDGTIFMLDDES